MSRVESGVQDKRVYSWTVTSPGYIKDVQDAIAFAKAKADGLGVDTKWDDWLKVEPRDEGIVFWFEVEVKPKRSKA